MKVKEPAQNYSSLEKELWIRQFLKEIFGVTMKPEYQSDLRSGLNTYFSKEKEYMQCSELIFPSLSVKDFVWSDFFLLAEDSSSWPDTDLDGKREWHVRERRAGINHPGQDHFGTVKGSMLVYTVGTVQVERQQTLWEPFPTFLMLWPNNSTLNTLFSGLLLYYPSFPGREHKTAVLLQEQTGDQLITQGWVPILLLPGLERREGFSYF